MHWERAQSLFQKRVSLFGKMKHGSKLASLIPAVLLHMGFTSNKFPPFAFKDASCQLQRCCRPLVFVSEFRRNGSRSDPAPAVIAGFCLCSCPRRTWLMLSGTWHQGCESFGFCSTNSSSLSCSSSRSSQVFVVQAHDPPVGTGTLGGFNATHPVHGSTYIWHQRFQLKAAAWCLQPWENTGFMASVAELRSKVCLPPCWQVWWTLFKLPKTQDVVRTCRRWWLLVSVWQRLNVNMTWPQPERKVHKDGWVAENKDRNTKQIKAKLTRSDKNQEVMLWTHTHTHTRGIKESGPDRMEETADIRQVGGGAYQTEG